VTDDIQRMEARALDDLATAMGERRLGKPFGVHPMFAWYDLWVGAYWDRQGRCLYVMLLPTLGFRVQLSTLEHDEFLRQRLNLLLYGHDGPPS
jgi:hypothetical protein